MEQKIEAILRRTRRAVVTIAPDASLQTAARLMNRERIGSLVVVDEADNIAGILSERDVLRGFADADADIRDMEVRRIMTHREKMIVGQSSDSVGQLMAVMTRNQIRHIPILSRDEPYRFIGMISIGDLVNARLSDSHTENRFLRDYIAGTYPG